MVAMETGHFIKMLNDAILASLGLLMWKVLGCIICKNPLWVLSCKVNLFRCHTISLWQLFEASELFTVGKKKNRLRQGLINIKRKLFSRKKGGKLKDGGKGSRKTKSASNVLEVVEDDP